MGCLFFLFVQINRIALTCKYSVYSTLYTCRLSAYILAQWVVWAQLWYYLGFIWISMGLSFGFYWVTVRYHLDVLGYYLHGSTGVSFGLTGVSSRFIGLKRCNASDILLIYRNFSGLSGCLGKTREVEIDYGYELSLFVPVGNRNRQWIYLSLFYFIFQKCGYKAIKQKKMLYLLWLILKLD